jgi:hypothetical protein
MGIHDQEDSYAEEETAHDQIEEMSRHDTYHQGSNHCARRRRGPENQSRAEVHPSHAEVPNRTRDRIGRDNGQRDGGELRRRLLWVEQQENRREDKATAGADERAVRRKGRTEGDPAEEAQRR